MKRRIYVYVVVGQNEHINEFNLSLRALKYFTSDEVLVVTDLSRNESRIEHSNILDIKTSESFTNHQAAIYLKTGLHRFLDMSNNYCYLDGDVLAIRESIDKIFDYFVPPVTFCSDHCKLKQFSEEAIHRPIDPNLKKKRTVLHSLFEIVNSNRIKKKHALKACIDSIIQNILFGITILLSLGMILIQQNQKKDKKDGSSKNFKSKYYENKSHLLVKLNEKVYHNPTHPVYYFMKEGFYHDKKNYRWIDTQGNIILVERSDRLAEEISKKFKIEVLDKNWQHWNGGVFLFNAESVEFMEQWHQWTLEIFNDPAWQTRDQGTLVATAWKFGLEKHPTLPIKYNFIADYHHPTMKYHGNLTFGFKGTKVTIEPEFLHIYHHWGDEEWVVWRDVENKILLQDATK